MDIRDLKAKELRAKTLEELKDILGEVTEEYAELKFQSSTGQVENTSKITLLRRSIARIKTLLSEKEKQNRTAGQE
jgi:large subunit ribosomal protein L29